MILVDSNVLIDVLTPDQEWRDWSDKTILEFTSTGEELVVNPVIVAELSSNFPDLASLLAALDSLDIEILPLDPNSAFQAGRAFRSYRRSGPDRGAILSDFLIGGHAARLGAALLTRDQAIYRRYLPDLTLITPETHP